MVENLYKRKLLDRNHVLTFADFTGKPRRTSKICSSPTSIWG